ncbi:hypothetical protein [Variovorax sp. YR752]|uniref:hypothetical protein n=1 Tax=Variovorax sp. YR752 TaxID=1884383 RepID=UPI003137DFB2
MNSYQFSDFLISSSIAFVVAYVSKGTLMRMILLAAVALAIETLLVQVIVVHRLEIWSTSYLMSALLALVVGVAVAFILRRRS